MSNWLPWALLAFVAVVVAAMPWRRPHPNHEFMLHMLRLLEDEDSDPSNFSSHMKNTSNANTAGRQLSSHTHI
jgi:hypothetical protein